MANRILIIHNERATELPMSMMDRFQQILLVVGKDQSNLPLEIVSQLLLAQAQYKVQIELLALKGAPFELLFALQLGRLIERHPEGQFTLLSPDNGLDGLIQSCKDQGIRLNRVESLQRVGGLEPAGLEPAHGQLDAEKTPPKPGASATTQAPAAAAATTAASPATTTAAPAASEEPESASSRNHRLISSLIGSKNPLSSR